MTFSPVLFFIPAVSILALIKISSAPNDMSSICGSLEHEFKNATLTTNVELQCGIVNSTVILIFLDHGWSQMDWDFYEERFQLLARRITAHGKYSSVVLSPHYFAFNPHFSISGIFLHVITNYNKDLAAAHLPEIKVWLHLRSKALHLLHEEKLVIPFLTNDLVSGTLEGLLLEGEILDPKKEWSWRGLSLYRQAVNSIRKDFKVKLALLVDHYQCSSLPLQIASEIFENFDVIYYYGYHRPDLEEAGMHVQKMGYVVPEERKVVLRAGLYEQCKSWFNGMVSFLKVSTIRGVFYGVENRDHFNFTEIKLVL